MQGAFKLVTVAEKSGTVRSKQGIGVIADHSFEDCPRLDVLLVPGKPFKITPISTGCSARVSRSKHSTVEAEPCHLQVARA